MVIKKTQFLGCFFLLLIILIAGFFRTWQLNLIPPGLYPDEAINGNEALESLKTKNFKVFYLENNGREGLFIWMLAFSFLIFKASIWSLRIVPAIFGILTVLGLHLFTRELIFLATKDKKQATCTALLASFFLSVSFWHVNFSRIGFRAILLPFCLVFSFYFLSKGFKKILFQEKGKRNIWNFIIAGIFFGLGFYTYASFRMAIAIIFLVLLSFLLLFKNKNLEKDFLKLSFSFMLTIIIVVLPLLFCFLNNPEYFVGRASQVFIFSQENPLKAFFESLGLHLAMFNFHGDGNWRHNIPDTPQLLWPVGILFLIGFFISIKELMISFKNKNLLPLACHLLLLSWFLVMLSPGILTYEAIPHALRTIGVIPVVYIFAGLGTWQIYSFFEKNTRNKTLLILSSVVFLFMVLSLQLDKYFIKWGQNPETENAFSQDYVMIGDYLNSIPPRIEKIVIINRSGVPVPWPDGIPMPAQTVMFIESTKFKEAQSLYLLPEKISTIKIDEKPTTIVVMAFEEKILYELLQRFPGGESKKINNILIYQVNY